MAFTVEWYHYVIVSAAVVLCAIFICIGCKLVGERNTKKMIMQEWVRQGMIAKINEKPIPTVLPAAMKVEDDPRLAVTDKAKDSTGEHKLGFISYDEANDRKDTAEWKLYSNRLAERYNLGPGNFRELVLTKPPGTSFGLYFEEHRPVIGLLEPDSPAEQQGLKSGMRVISVNNLKIYTPAEAVEAFQKPSSQYVCVVDVDTVDSPGMRQVKIEDQVIPIPPKKEHFVDNEVEELLRRSWEEDQGRDEESTSFVFVGKPFVASVSEPPPPPSFKQFNWETIRSNNDGNDDVNSILKMTNDEMASLPRRRAPPARFTRDHAALGLRRPRPLESYISPPGIRRNNPTNVTSRRPPPLPSSRMITSPGWNSIARSRSGAV